MYSGHNAPVTGMTLSLVTGAAGFIGSHLTSQLLSKGHRVIGIDNLSSGQLQNLRPFLKLEWLPKVDLRQGLKTTIAYFQEWNSPLTDIPLPTKAIP